MVQVTNEMRVGTASLVFLITFISTVTTEDTATALDVQNLYKGRNKSFEPVRKTLLSVGRILRSALCNRVVLFGMVICPYNESLPVPIFSIMDRTPALLREPIEKANRTSLPREEDSEPSVVNKEPKFTSRKSYSQSLRMVKSICMEGVYDERLDKCLTYREEPLTFEEAEYFCKELSPGGTVLDPQSTADQTDNVLMSKQIIPVKYSIWVNGLYLEDSVVGTGLFDADLRRRLKIKRITGFLKHFARVVLKVENSVPYYTYQEEGNLNSVVCQTFPLLTADLSHEGNSH